MKKVFLNEGVRHIDSYTIQTENISSVKLMDKAAKAFVNQFQKLYTAKNKVVIICGSGNNGGDGLAIARLLSENQYHVTVIALAANTYSTDYLIQAERLLKTTVQLFSYDGSSDIVTDLLKHNDVLIDAIFGTGLNRIPKDQAAELIQLMNSLHKEIVSVDVPSGLSENYLPAILHTVKATHTISFQVHKLSLLLQENSPFIGCLHLVDIGLSAEAIQKENAYGYMMEWEDIPSFFTLKNAYDNKWNNGHAVLCGGSTAKAGAMLLAAESCLHSGCGLTTAIIPASIQTAFNIRLPEVMLQPDLHQQLITHIPTLPYADAYGIGCGLGTSELTQQALLQFLFQCDKPIVLDADALNILSTQKPKYTLPKKCILTPHFKEFDRLTKPHISHLDRLDTLRRFCLENQCTVILKAAHSVICTKEGQLFFCNYPSAALGKAGTGDVLTGIITSLLAQGYDELQSCQIALHLIMHVGRSVEKKYTAHVASATLLIQQLPKAIKKLCCSR